MVQPHGKLGQHPAGAFHRFMYFMGTPGFETHQAVFALNQREANGCVIVSPSAVPSATKPAGSKTPLRAW